MGTWVDLETRLQSLFLESERGGDSRALPPFPITHSQTHFEHPYCTSGASADDVSRQRASLGGGPVGICGKARSCHGRCRNRCGQVQPSPCRGPSSSLSFLRKKYFRPMMVRLYDKIKRLNQPSSYDDPSSDTSPSNLTTSGSTPSTGTSDWAICHVVCNFDFESPDPDQLSFSKDEVLAVVKKEDSGWWAAMRLEGDRIGWIPSSFVEPLPEWKLDEMVLEHEPDILRAFDDEREMEVYPHTIEGDELWIPFEDLKVPPMQIIDPTDIIPPSDPSQLREHSIDSFVFTDCMPLPLDIISPPFPLSSVPHSSVLQGLAPHVTRKLPFRRIALKSVSPHAPPQ